MITIVKQRVARNICVANLKVKVTAGPCSQKCPADNCVILSRLLKRFQKNDNQIKKTCCAQHFGRHLEGQYHSMTLQKNFVIWSRIKKLFYRNDHHFHPLQSQEQ